MPAVGSHRGRFPAPFHPLTHLSTPVLPPSTHAFPCAIFNYVPVSPQVLHLRTQRSAYSCCAVSIQFTTLPHDLPSLPLPDNLFFLLAASRHLSPTNNPGGSDRCHEGAVLIFDLLPNAVRQRHAPLASISITPQVTTFFFSFLP